MACGAVRHNSVPLRCVRERAVGIGLCVCVRVSISYSFIYLFQVLIINFGTRGFCTRKASMKGFFFL